MVKARASMTTCPRNNLVIILVFIYFLIKLVSNFFWFPFPFNTFSGLLVSLPRIPITTGMTVTNITPSNINSKFGIIIHRLIFFPIYFVISWINEIQYMTSSFCWQLLYPVFSFAPEVPLEFHYPRRILMFHSLWPNSRLCIKH